MKHKINKAKKLIIQQKNHANVDFSGLNLQHLRKMMKIAAAIAVTVKITAAIAAAISQISEVPAKYTVRNKTVEQSPC